MHRLVRGRSRGGSGGRVSEIVQIRPRGYKKNFMLNSAEHEIFHANKSQIINSAKFFLAKQLSMKISLLINMKMQTIVGIFIFISREKFMLSWVEHHGKSFITSGPDCTDAHAHLDLRCLHGMRVFFPRYVPNGKHHTGQHTWARKWEIYCRTCVLKEDSDQL